jgi:hypothetical protein
MTAHSIARDALQAVLKVGRGSSGRLILEASDEQAVEAALETSSNARTDIERQYDELFEVAAKAASEANCGTPRSHDDLISALQLMGIQSVN